MEQKHYSYRAFISYRHVDRDRRWAKWLVSKLETYRTPKSLVQEGVPQRIGKLFRDDDEIPASSDLSNQLEQALKDSEFLIVICSPDTPSSEWVRREITLFQEMGRADRIIPLLVAGEPENSFPPELLSVINTRILADGTEENYREKIEPLAADVRTRADEKPSATQHRAFIRIAAALLRCKFDDLEQRECKRQLKKRRLQTGIAASLLLCILAGGIYWWDYTRIQTHYYQDYVTRWAVPEGLGKLSHTQAEKMNVSYALQYQRRKLIGMIRQTGAQKRIGLPDEYQVDPWLIGTAEWSFEYDSDGKLSEATLLDAPGKEHLQIEYNFANNGVLTTRFTTQDDAGHSSAAELRTVSAWLGGAERKSDITQHLVEFDGNGRVFRREFQNSRGYTAKDTLGSAGRIYEYYDNGQLAVVGYSGELGDNITLKNGIHQVSFQYNTQNHRSGWRIEDKSKHLIIGDFGYAKRTQTYDDRGNLIEQAYWGADDALIPNNNGYAKYAQAYDEQGNLIEWTYLGIDDAPILNKKGYAKVTQAYDEYNNVIEQAFWDTDNTPVLGARGYAKVTQVYDEHGNVIEQAYSGTDDGPILNKNGYAKLTQVFDGHGNIIGIAYFGADDEPILQSDHYAKTTSVFDDRGNLIEQAYWGTDGGPILQTSGFAKFTQAYDERGNVIEQAYWSTDGVPILRSDGGFAKLTMAYDDRGNLIEQAFWDADYAPILQVDGYAKYTQDYDERGNLLGQAYWGTDNTPILNTEGYAKYTAVYDDRGNLIERVFRGIDNAPTLHKTGGFAKFTAAYDDRGYLIEQIYWGVNDSPILITGGYAKLTQIFDDHGNLIEQAYWSLNDAPIVITAGHAKLTQIFDERGNLIEQTHWGVDDSPILISRGYAKLTQIFDERGNLIEQTHWGVDDSHILIPEGYAKVTVAYDGRDKQIELAYWGVDDSPILIAEGYAKLTQAYDGQGNVIAQSYWGTDNMPILITEGYAKRTRIFDNGGNPVEQAYWSVNGSLVMNTEGYAKSTTAYNEQDSLTETNYFGVDGQPIINKEGFSKIVVDHDQRGNIIREQYFNEQAQLIINNRQFAIATAIRDERGRLIGERYFDANEEPTNRNNLLVEEELSSVLGEWKNLILRGIHGEATLANLDEGGFHYVEQLFSGRGNIIQQSFFGIDDKPIAGFDGFVKVNVAYGDTGLPELIEGQLPSSKNNIVKLQLRYNARRNIERVSYLSEDGSLLLSNLGFAEMAIYYDEFHRQSKVDYLDANGNIVSSQ
jgi:YD repeat-containing protein